ncbi:unnamed protein product [Malus baccata var. baccata]
MESGCVKLLCATEKGSGRAKQLCATKDGTALFFSILLFAFSYDISTLLLDTKAFKDTIDLFVERYKDKEIYVVVGVEARGFIFGPSIALATGAKFVPLRKPKKLPDVKAVMKNSGTAMLGLIGSSIQSATGVVYNITGGGRKLLLVVGAGSPFFFAHFLGLMKSANYCKCSGPSVNITFGAVVDDRYNGELHVTIIATGFS